MGSEAAPSYPLRSFMISDFFDCFAFDLPFDFAQGRLKRFFVVNLKLCSSVFIRGFDYFSMPSAFSAASFVQISSNSISIGAET